MPSYITRPHPTKPGVVIIEPYTSPATIVVALIALSPLAAFFLKNALIVSLKSHGLPWEWLAGVSVFYAWPTMAMLACIIGIYRFTRRPVILSQDEPFIEIARRKGE